MHMIMMMMMLMIIAVLLPVNEIHPPHSNWICSVKTTRTHTHTQKRQINVDDVIYFYLVANVCTREYIFSQERCPISSTMRVFCALWVLNSNSSQARSNCAFTTHRNDARLAHLVGVPVLNITLGIYTCSQRPVEVASLLASSYLHWTSKQVRSNVMCVFCCCVSCLYAEFHIQLAYIFLRNKHSHTHSNYLQSSSHCRRAHTKHKHSR